jgi:hypothetical protein
MAQKKKKKQLQPLRRDAKNKAVVDETFRVFRKVLRAYGFEPDLLDWLTKRQRSMLCYLKVDPPRFKVREGFRVPGRLVNFVAESTHHFMRNHFFGDRSIGLSYLELVTYGLSFANMVANVRELSAFRGEQLEVFDYLAEGFKDKRVNRDLLPISTHIRHTVMMISKVNFRIYGFDWKILFQEGTNHVTSTVYLSSEECKSIRFTYKGRERTAFRVRAGRVIDLPASDAKLDRWFIFHEEEEPPVFLDIYIQSHALQRAKERFDIFPAHRKNHYVMEPLLYMHRVAQTPSGEPMLECYTEVEGRRVCFGYFPFVIQKNRLIVLTFLPLASPRVFEGSYLWERFGLGMEDTKFLQMDKLSFFLTVDFEQIPVLKKAMEATDIRNLIEYAANHPDVQFGINPQKTQMVKKFFEGKIAYDSGLPEMGDL